MYRRAFLATLAGGTASLGVRSAIPVAGSTGDGLDYGPLATRSIPGAAECVLGDDGTTAFVAATTGFATVDVSDPTDPRVLATVEDVAADHEDGPLGSILDVKLDGDRLLVSGPAQSGDPRGLVVYDVSDPADPVPATEFHETPFSIHNSFLLDGYAYLTNARPLWPNLTVVDVSGQRPEEVARWSPRDYDPPDADGWQDMVGLPWGIHDVYVHGDYAYCAIWDAGTWILDVSEPTAPSFVSRIGQYTLQEVVEAASLSGDTLWRRSMEVPGNDHSVAVDETGDLLAIGAEGWDVADTETYGVGGIRLYDTSDPRDPEQLGTIDPPRIDDAGLKGTWVTAHNFDLHGGRLYSGWYQAGLRIHDLADPTVPEAVAAWRDPASSALWGAQFATDETVVATAYDWSGRLWEGLLTFPNRPGTQADPPPLGSSGGTTTGTGTTTTTTAEPPETITPLAGETGTRTTTTRASTSTTTTPEPTTRADATTSESPTTTTTNRETTAQETPGYGMGATLVGLGIGLGAWWHRRERE